MPRKRLRDWPQRGYKYAVLDAEIPQSMWDQARKMQDLYNKLAESHQLVRESINDKTPDPERKAKWVEWDEKVARQLCRDSGLGQECDVDVLDRFKKACVAAAKDPSRGWPRPGAFKVSIQHRISGGGSPLTLLHSSRARRVRFSGPLEFPVGERHIRTGIFGLNDKSEIQFRACIHRPMPAGAILKSIRWLGEHQKAFGWRWWLVLTCELPPEQQHKRVPTGRRAAIDVGWRLRDDVIRIGYLADSTGHVEEFVLPLDFSTHDSRKWRPKYPDWVPIPQNHCDIWALASRRDLLFEALKADLRQILQPLPPQFEKMRRGGILKLARTLAEASPDSPALARIRTWQDTDRPLFRVQSAAQQRFVQRRRDLYRRLARRLALAYDEISVEKLDIKGMIKAVDKAHGLRAGDRYHQIAATYDFLLALKIACSTFGAKFQQKEANFSTSKCALCGAKIEPGPSLLLTCSNGHTLDQDQNAARNLLQHEWPAAKTANTSRKAFFEERRKQKDAVSAG